MKIRSISQFLVTASLISVMITVSVISYWSYQEAHHEIEELFDAELAQSARTLQSLLRNQLQRTTLGKLPEGLYYQAPDIIEDDSEDNEVSQWGHKYEKKLVFYVWNASGELLLSNTELAIHALTSVPGYDNETIDQQHWRSFQLFDNQLNIWIKVAQRSDIRGELTDEIVETSILPLLLLMPLLAMIIYGVIRRGLEPLKQLSHDISGRSPDNLQAIPTTDTPTELHTVINAINHLMIQLNHAIQREREFTADAAHELRTPLAAIRVHSQNLYHYLQNDSSKATTKQQQTIQHIINGVDRMTHVVNQLLTLMRIQQVQHHHLLSLNDTVKQEMEQLLPLAQEKQHQLTTDFKNDIKLIGDKEALATLCRNLIENAIRYTPTAGHITVTLQRQGEQAQLQISDNGPGIPDKEKHKVLERFYRMQHQEISGSGLGLSITKEIANQLNATVTLSDNRQQPTGLTVTVCFAQSH